MANHGGGVVAAAALVVAALITVAAQQADPGECSRRPVVFAFGDSNTDTGGAAAGLGYYFPLPEGRDFFRRSTGRLCDGRLVIDYLCEPPIILFAPYFSMPNLHVHLVAVAGNVFVHG